MAIQIEYNCEKHKIKRTSIDPTIAAYSANYDYAHFSFCPDWDGLNITVCFEHETRGKILVLPDEENVVPIPLEVNAFPGFYVSVIGNDAEGKRITSVRDFVIVERSGLGKSDYTGAPTPDVYSQIYSKAEHAEEVAQSVRDDADAGKFKGDQGPAGPVGPAGPQGEKGDTGAVVGPEAGLFYFGVQDGHLILQVGTDEQGQHFSIDPETGHLYYDFEE